MEAPGCCVQDSLQFSAPAGLTAFRSSRRKKYFAMKNFHKFHAREVWHDGIRFPSTGEGDRYLFLKDCQRNGKISGLKLQVPFQLYPAVYEEKTLKRGPRKGQVVNGRLVWEGVSYICDFVYTLPDGRCVVEDFKGVQTPVFKLKRRLMHELLGIDIKIVKRPCEAV